MKEVLKIKKWKLALVIGIFIGFTTCLSFYVITTYTFFDFDDFYYNIYVEKDWSDTIETYSCYDICHNLFDESAAVNCYGD